MTRIFTGPRRSGSGGCASLSSGPPVIDTVTGNTPERTADGDGFEGVGGRRRSAIGNAGHAERSQATSDGGQVGRRISR